MFFRVSFEKGIIHKLGSKTQKRPFMGFSVFYGFKKHSRNPIYKSLPQKLGLTFENMGCGLLAVNENTTLPWETRWHTSGNFLQFARSLPACYPQCL